MSNEHKRTLTATCWKTRYDNMSTARKAIRGINKTKRGKRAKIQLNVYKCVRCSGYHLTSKMINDWTSKNNK